MQFRHQESCRILSDHRIGGPGEQEMTDLSGENNDDVRTVYITHKYEP